jgi:nicotinate-nucleotide adenylyltransferase
MRIGYLGGSFDPVHLGHLALAAACREGARLDLVVLVVTGTPPHKPDRRLAPAEHRLAMARLAVEGRNDLLVDARETRRDGPSYTIDTVRSLQSEHPGDELHWIIGGDTVPELTTWRAIGDLADRVGFVIAARPGHEPGAGLDTLVEHLGEERVERLRDNVVPMRPVKISSTAIRERVRKGISIDGLVPEAVRRYIESHGLYRD